MIEGVWFKRPVDWVKFARGSGDVKNMKFHSATEEKGGWPEMIFSEFSVFISYESHEGDSVDVIYDHHVIVIQEKEKSFFTPQSMRVTEDAQTALDAFFELKSNKHAGYEAIEIEIETINGDGDDTNL